MFEHRCQLVSTSIDKCYPDNDHQCIFFKIAFIPSFNAVFLSIRTAFAKDTL